MIGPRRSLKRTPLKPSLQSGKVRRVMASALLGIALLGANAWQAPAATAQELSIDRSVIAKELQERHEEKPSAMGIAENGGIIELFASEDGATWTLILTMPSGRSMVIGAGYDWSNVRQLVKGQKI